MTLDLALVRSLLITIEKLPAGQPLEGDFEVDCKGKSREEIVEHLYLMNQHGLIEAMFVPGAMGEPVGFIVQRITWEGHEFLALAKNNKAWKRALGIAAEKGGGITIGIMKDLLVHVAKHLFLDGI